MKNTSFWTLSQRWIFLCLSALLTVGFGFGAEQLENRTERLEWFKDVGFGLFIHWSVDSQLGSVISHSMVGASDDYLDRFIGELPKTFYPSKFDPDAWARLAKVVGVKYVVFTTKHHSGFCMFRTDTHSFNVMNTPYGQDITGQIVHSFRNQGMGIGFYYSPDDFYVLHRQNERVSRRRAEAQPVNNPELMQNNRQQVQELLTQYGPVDVMFFDGPPEGLLQLTWRLQPDTIITRGVMTTPEIAPSTGQSLPGETLSAAWEANFTMGTSWQFKPTNEQYRSGTDLIESLVETRAKGGTMLLNIGPTPEGEIPFEQERILREMGLWIFVNGEAIYGVRPWVVTNEGDVWFTKKKDQDTVYAIVTGEKWSWGEERSLSIRSIRLGEESVVSVLGQDDKILEYQPEVIPETRWKQGDEELQITATRAQRLYNDRTWPNPVVLKITHAKPAN